MQDTYHPVSRRDMLGLLGKSTLMVSAGGVLLMGRPSRAVTQPVPAQRPLLPRPRQLGAHEPIVAMPVDLALSPRGGQRGFGYNGSSPGPTIRMRRGQQFTRTLENRLDQETSVHWHGIIAPSEMDGQPQEAFGPGQRQSITFPIVQRASLNWYHPHPHGITGMQAWHGMAGFFIVEDEEEAALGLPGGEQELLLALRDTQLDEQGRLIYDRQADGTTGDTPLVNGVPWPRTRLANQYNRLRILNGSNARIFQLASQAPLVLIGNDGGLLAAPQQVDGIAMAPGERIDVLMDLRGFAPGSKVYLRDSGMDWDLLEIEVAAAPPSQWEVPTRLSEIEVLRHDGPPDREFVFQQSQGINGQSHDMARVDFVAQHGKVERWRFRQARGRFHPVHVHGVHFQVQRASPGNDIVARPWEQGWKDTVEVARGGYVDALVRFDGYEGRYLIHCHKLEHEDEGMMMNFVIAKDVEMAARRIEAERLFGANALCIADNRII